MQVYIRPFNPKPLQGVNTLNLAVTGTTGTIALGAFKNQGRQSIRIVNSGTQVVFLNFSVGTGTATTTTDMPMLPNTSEVFWLGEKTTNINAIAAATGSTLYVTIGEGV
jgi:hypothetical protein